MKLKPVLATAALCVCSLPALACYTVFDQNSKIIYRAQAAPVDMSMQLKDALNAARYPAGSFMIFDLGNDCPAQSTVTALPAPLDASAKVATAVPARRRASTASPVMSPVAPATPPAMQPVVPVMTQQK